jgi:hypothetical protein
VLWLADVVTPTRSVLKVRVLAAAFALLACRSGRSTT